jgi:hypothetical protein
MVPIAQYNHRFFTMGTQPSLFQVRFNMRNAQKSPLDTTLHLYLEACTSVIHISECSKCVGPKGSLT